MKKGMGKGEGQGMGKGMGMGMLECGGCGQNERCRRSNPSE